MEESKNDINNRLHQSDVSTTSEDIKPGIVQSSRNNQETTNESKGNTRNNSESEKNTAVVPPTETESIVWMPI